MKSFAGKPVAATSGPVGPANASSPAVKAKPPTNASQDQLDQSDLDQLIGELSSELAPKTNKTSRKRLSQVYYPQNSIYQPRYLNGQYQPALNNRYIPQPQPRVAPNYAVQRSLALRNQAVYNPALRSQTLDAYGNPIGRTLDAYGNPINAAVDAFGNPVARGVDAFGNPIGATTLDAYGNPIARGVDAYGNPIGATTLDAYGNPIARGVDAYGNPIGRTLDAFGNPVQQPVLYNGVNGAVVRNPAVLGGPVYAQNPDVWANWGAWSACPVFCNYPGELQRQRSRQCLSLSGVGCLGEPTQVRPCPCEQQASTWGPWGQFSPCTVSCGQGTQTKTRFCSPIAGQCGGSAQQTQLCYRTPCPRRVGAEVWARWAGVRPEALGGEGLGGVSVTREGLLLRGREPRKADIGGSAQRTQICYRTPCARLALWGQWSECSATCGDGTRQRLRLCQQGDCFNVGALEQTNSCNYGPCPVFQAAAPRSNCAWSAWSSTSSCSVSCGSGSQERTRQCQCFDNRQGGCPGLSFQSQTCLRGRCPLSRSPQDFAQAGRVFTQDGQQFTRGELVNGGRPLP